MVNVWRLAFGVAAHESQRACLAAVPQRRMRVNISRRVCTVPEGPGVGSRLRAGGRRQIPCAADPSGGCRRIGRETIMARHLKENLVDGFY
jgi:hypothetical protein